MRVPAPRRLGTLRAGMGVRSQGMRLRLVVALALLPGAGACAHPAQVTPAGPAASVAAHQSAAAPQAVPAADRGDFALRVQPILEQRCRPCHFAGGQVYAQLPFDRAETVLRLREKLFTRLKDEPTRQTIRDFLALHR
jgi:hypothetical protein